MSSSSRFARVILVLPVVLAACSDSSSTTSTVASVAPPAVTTTSCAAPQTLTAGQVVVGLSGSSVCIGGVSTTAEYVLVPFNGSTATSASFTVSADGATAPSASVNLLSASTAGTLSSLSVVNSTLRSTRSFEAGLRIRERAELTPLISSARTWAKMRTRAGAAYDIIPRSVTVGQILRLNANAEEACGSPSYRGGRVVAITNKAIVVADTLNPTGGFTDAEYAALGATFDTLVDPVDRAAFGDPSDIDGNGKVLMFFTKAVNDLTPATSSSYVGGFFYSRDLFPPVASANVEACAGSNKGEMFYLMVPDPSRGGAFTKANVTNYTTATTAHEYQHLINASRRMYVNNAAEFEETWLDEGLAHVAEELLFYRASGMSPRQNLDITTIRASASAVNAFNTYQSSNFGRYDEFLLNPSGYSPIANNDSLATRGASWSFLRYAADHLGNSDGTTWYQLVNSTTSGIANLQNVFGSAVMNELRDWGTSVIADDVTGVSSTYQQTSWNFRSIFSALGNTGTFPLATTSIASGSRTVNLTRGANAYLRFAVAAGGSATPTWGSVPLSVQFTLVRLK